MHLLFPSPLCTPHPHSHAPLTTLPSHGARVSCELSVLDLHRVTPRRFIEVGGASIHELSYQQARNINAPLGQVYVAEVNGCMHVAVQSQRGTGSGEQR